MGNAIKGRAGLTAQMPLEYAVKLGELAEALHISRHRLTVLALFAGLDIAAAQVRAEQAAKATKPSSSDAKE